MLGRRATGRLGGRAASRYGMTCDYGRREADNFLVQLDVTPPIFVECGRQAREMESWISSCASVGMGGRDSSRARWNINIQVDDPSKLTRSLLCSEGQLLLAPPHPLDKVILGSQGSHVSSVDLTGYAYEFQPAQLRTSTYVIPC